MKKENDIYKNNKNKKEDYLNFDLNLPTPKSKPNYEYYEANNNTEENMKLVYTIESDEAENKKDDENNDDKDWFNLALLYAIKEDLK
ncbi:hypothetical protein [uncultured Fenollaria sp.]|uniref:hypothetical protein n=1 Tax=uncultured Fenollaria sp. TaxID=1686315 RepID=UPI0025FAC78F|nr:hypothetical protein [uncultured Fenollaria sp.]